MKKCYDLTERPEGIIRFVEGFLPLSELKTYEPGEIIVEQGVNHASFFLVLEGYAETYKTGKDGTIKNYGLLGPYSLIGFSSLDGYADHTTLRARTPMLFAVMPRERVREWSREMLLTVIKIQTEKSRNSHRQLIYEHMESTASRVARLLLEIGSPGRDPAAENIPCRSIFGTSDIARQVNASTARVAQVLRDMERGRAVKMIGKQIVFIPRKLESWLEE